MKMERYGAFKDHSDRRRVAHNANMKNLRLVIAIYVNQPQQVRSDGDC
jgi:hypothetical protein